MTMVNLCKLSNFAESFPDTESAFKRYVKLVVTLQQREKGGGGGNIRKRSAPKQPESETVLSMINNYSY